jgi:hypothetical protein
MKMRLKVFGGSGGGDEQMNIKEARAEKDNMERTIQYFIQDQIREFEEKTGVLINALEIEMIPLDEPGLTKEVTVRAIIIL